MGGGVWRVTKRTRRVRRLPKNLTKRTTAAAGVWRTQTHTPMWPPLPPLCGVGASVAKAKGYNNNKKQPRPMSGLSLITFPFRQCRGQRRALPGQQHEWQTPLFSSLSSFACTQLCLCLCVCVWVRQTNKIAGSVPSGVASRLQRTLRNAHLLQDVLAVAHTHTHKHKVNMYVCVCT